MGYGLKEINFTYLSQLCSLNIDHMDSNVCCIYLTATQGSVINAVHITHFSQNNNTKSGLKNSFALFLLFNGDNTNRPECLHTLYRSLPLERTNQ